MALFVHLNGSLLHSADALISIDNPSFRYGDGCFETMALINGNLPLAHYHMRRFLYSLEHLDLSVPSFFSTKYLTETANLLALQNNHAERAIVRLIAYRQEGIAHNTAGLLIETKTYVENKTIPEDHGLSIGICPLIKKSCDQYSFIKSNSRLSYQMAAQWAANNNVDEAIVCNAFNMVADATIYNVFIVENGTIVTPPLSDGGIDGVMRRYLLDQLKGANMPVHERSISIGQLEQAREIFLTNAVRGIRWVQRMGHQQYTHTMADFLLNTFVLPLWK